MGGPRDRAVFQAEGGALTEHYDPAEVKGRLAFLDLMAEEGVVMRRSGANWVGCCPFHDERSGSFTVHAPALDHGHCYGCGWNGDIFDFWMEKHGRDFAEALRALASLASVSPSVFEATRRKQAAVPRMTDVAADTQKEKPTLPRLRPLSEEEVGQLAGLRGLSVEGIAAAAREKRVGGCEWPQYEDHRGCWGRAADAGPCWVVTDGERRVAQFRRLSGLPFVRFDGREIKAWTKGSPTWPIGAAEIGDRYPVLLVEGGADMLAAYHFLAMFRRLQAVAVCAMFGASCAIAEAALPFFVRRRVRIMAHYDEGKPKPGKPDGPLVYAGTAAAARWTEQLAGVGAAVETFTFGDLLKKDGSRAKDLNDLALCDESVWTDHELLEAFFDFDF
jgi:hypothetical protein